MSHLREKLVRTAAILLFAGITAGAGVYFGGQSANAPTTATIQSYSCPMHPEIADIKPSDCPKCRMKLVLAEGTEEATQEQTNGEHGCCSKKAPAASQLPAGHPPVAGMEAPTSDRTQACPMGAKAENGQATCPSHKN